MNNKIFFTSTKIDTYQRLYNFIVGIRGVGKTYHFTQRCIKRALKEKRPTFVWIRRLVKDVDNIKSKWWFDVEHLFPNYKFFNIKYDIYAEDKITGERFMIGELIALNDYISAKSTPHPYVRDIVFDEFMAEGANKYLGDEVTKFMNLCDSIIRLRTNVKVYFLGNAVSMLNPYFDYFGIPNTAQDENFVKGSNWVVENCDYKEFREVRASTDFGQSIKGTKYGDYSLENKFLLDDTSDIEPDVKGSKQVQYNLMCNDKLICVYLVNNLLYFAQGRDTSLKTFTPYVSDAKKYGAIYCDKKNGHLRFITNQFLNGACLYETLAIKNEIQIIVSMIYRNYEPNK